MTNKKRFVIGESDFERYRKDDAYLIDKTLFIKEIINDENRVILLPRPRRFGKTLNLSMLYYFFTENAENKYLFKGLKIEKTSEFNEHINQYPVIYLTFKSIKGLKFKDVSKMIISEIKREFNKFEYIEELVEDKEDKLFFNKLKSGNINIHEIGYILKFLSKYIYLYHKKEVIILIDEYDTPIHEAYFNNYYPEMINFMKVFMSNAFKDNKYLFKGVITGILRVAKESIFSGLNNLGTYSLIHKDFSTYFGFTQEEINQIVLDFNLQKYKKDIENWYNGYIFGGTIIYNPWSIINFTSRLEDGFLPYWRNSSGNDLIKELVAKGSVTLKEEIKQLIDGKTLFKPLDEHIYLGDIDKKDAIYSLLVFSGYLKVLGKKKLANKDVESYELIIPNIEIRKIFKDTIEYWFDSINFGNANIEMMFRAMIMGNIDGFESYLAEFLINFLSFYDIVREPEAVYQAFLLGLFINFNSDYIVESNKESGFGRYDIMVYPRKDADLNLHAPLKQYRNHAIILELKSIKEDEDFNKSMNEALKQIKDKKYEQSLIQKGFKKENILKYGIVFKKKKVKINFLEDDFFLITREQKKEIKKLIELGVTIEQIADLKSIPIGEIEKLL